VTQNLHKKRVLGLRDREEQIKNAVKVAIWKGKGRQITRGRSRTVKANGMGGGWKKLAKTYEPGATVRMASLLEGCLQKGPARKG